MFDLNLRWIIKISRLDDEWDFTKSFYHFYRETHLVVEESDESVWIATNIHGYWNINKHLISTLTPHIWRTAGQPTWSLLAAWSWGWLTPTKARAGPDEAPVSPVRPHHGSGNVALECRYWDHPGKLLSAARGILINISIKTLYLWKKRKLIFLVG